MNHVEVFLLRGLALLVSASLLALTGSVLAQQGEDQLPPQVIEIIPYPGEEVLTDQPVAVTFDQAMDAASVESAWQSDPAITGQFAWTDGKTLTFTPAEGWQRATRYNISIGTEAKAANGLPLVEPYKFFVQTIGYLEVTTVIPAADAEGVSADATITVSFSRPVVPLVSTEQLADLPQPVVIEPALDGKGEWLNTSVFMFTPSKPLSGGTTYTVSVPAGLKDMLGATLDQTVSWKFKTLAPEILNVYPYQSESGVRLERPVTIEFSQPMDRASTEAAFSLIYGGEPVKGAFSWSEDSRSLTFQPEPKLNIES
ncbi:MAG: Ig-like domain-containing protein, partial [Chloroflexi bacterium]|nr:Ig-like domain-containing protein [Chloroflexota bacterium]